VTIRNANGATKSVRTPIDASMVTRGESRSAIAPPTTIRMALGSDSSKSTVPRAKLEPVSCRTSHAMAMKLKK
jgi:hypothetical protein